MKQISTPKRIQRKRTKGWKMPENTVYVGRPTKWGNPYKINGDMVYGDASHRRKIFSPWVYVSLANYYPKEKSLNEIVVDLYDRWIGGINTSFLIPPPTIEEVKESLKGKNLACFCPLDKPCHADVLLKIANE